MLSAEAQESIDEIIDKVIRFLFDLRINTDQAFLRSTEKDLNLVFSAKEGLISIDENIEELSLACYSLRHILFRSIYQYQIPKKFWQTPLGEAIATIECHKGDSEMTLAEVARYLGRSEMWVLNNKIYLGAYEYGSGLAFKRSFIKKFKNEYLGKTAFTQQYWETVLGKDILALFDSKEREEKQVGVKYVQERVLDGKYSRQWIYDHADELGGEMKRKRLVFIESIVRKKLKELLKDI